MDVQCRDRRGPQTLKCWLDDEQGRSREYTFTTTVYEDAAFSDRILSFSDVVPKESATKATVLRLFAADAATTPVVAGLRVSGTPHLKVRPDRATVEVDANGVVVTSVPIEATLTLPPESQAGAASIFAEIRANGKVEEVKVDCDWRIRRVFNVEPNQLVWRLTPDASDAGSKVRGDLTVTSAESSAFRILRVTGLPDWVVCGWDRSAAAVSHRMTFEVEPGKATIPYSDAHFHRDRPSIAVLG